MKKGFTLAEVLITLAIIGVVAALTIPTVVRNYQKQQTVVKLKKTYSALANTTSLAVAEHGPVNGWSINQPVPDFVSKYLIPFLKVQKNCGIEIDGDCKFEYKYLNKATVYTLGTYAARFYLTDGTLIGVQPADYIVCNTVCYYGTEALIYIDINGRKPPNTYGKDIFIYVYFIDTPDVPTAESSWSSKFNGKFMPYGFGLTRDQLANTVVYTTAACSKVMGGHYCAALIMKDGWQIKDDYPW